MKSSVIKSVMSNGSRQQVKEILQRLFIDNPDTFQVLAVKGKWGVGKTHLVKDFLKQHKENKSYYYASVFGLSSLEELKAQILSNQGLAPQVLKWINKNFNQVQRVPTLKDIFLRNSVSLPIAGSTITLGSNIISSMMFNAINNAIICIDDLERKSNLQLDEILGFIEYLVEERQCQVILIFNEEQLIKEDESKQSLEEYREKVIDLEVELNPTIEENLFLQNEKDEYISFDPNDPDIETIQEVLTTAKTNNIRILKRIRWNLDQFISLMKKDWNPTIRSQIIRNIIIISLAKLDNTFSLDIDKILSYEKITTNKTVQNKEDIDNDIAILGSVLKWEYANLEVNSEIISLIETGLFVESQFQEKGQQLSDQEDSNQIREKFRDIWQPYYSSFANNESEISDRINTFLQENCLYLNIDDFAQLNHFISVLNLDISHYKKQFFKQFIQKCDPVYLEELKQIIQQKFSDLSPDLVESLEKRIKEHNKTKSITSILLKMIENNAYSREDEAFLKSKTVEDYYKWLKKGHPKLVSMVRYSLERLISQNLQEAIKRLAKESPLNRMRAEKLYNITIEDSSTELRE